MLDQVAPEVCAWTAALGVVALIVVALSGRRPAIRLAIAGSLVAVTAGFVLASGAGLIDAPMANAASIEDDVHAASVPPRARPSDEQELLVAAAVSALAAAPGLVEAVRLRLAGHESPPAPAVDGGPAR